MCNQIQAQLRIRLTYPPPLSSTTKGKLNQNTYPSSLRQPKENSIRIPHPLLFDNQSKTQSEYLTPLLFDNQSKTQPEYLTPLLFDNQSPAQSESLSHIHPLPPLLDNQSQTQSELTPPPPLLTTKAQPNQNHSHLSTHVSLTTKVKPSQNQPPPPPPPPPHPFRQPKPSPVRVKLTWQDDGLLGPVVGPVELLQHRQVVGANIRGGVQSAVRPLRVHAAVHARAPGRYVQLQGVFHLSRGALRVKLYHHPPHSVGELQLGKANTKTYTHTHTPHTEHTQSLWVNVC